MKRASADVEQASLKRTRYEHEIFDKSIKDIEQLFNFKIFHNKYDAEPAINGNYNRRFYTYEKKSSVSTTSNSIDNFKLKNAAHPSIQKTSNTQSKTSSAKNVISHIHESSLVPVQTTVSRLDEVNHINQINKIKQIKLQNNFDSQQYIPITEAKKNIASFNLSYDCINPDFLPTRYSSLGAIQNKRSGIEEEDDYEDSDEDDEDEDEDEDDYEEEYEDDESNENEYEDENVKHDYTIQFSYEFDYYGLDELEVFKKFDKVDLEVDLQMIDKLILS